MRGLLVCVLMFEVACFDPSLPAVMCGQEGLCPPGLTCNEVSNMCEGPGVPPLPDATPTIDSAPGVCTWSKNPRLFDPCDFPTDDVDVTIDEDVVYDTTVGTVMMGTFNAVPMGTLITVDGRILRLISVSSFQIILGRTLRATGDYPLAIVSFSDIDISGVVNVSSDDVFDGAGTSSRVDCGASEGAEGQVEGGGGGGGGFGGAGAAGGSEGGELGGSGGVSSNLLVELRAGCEGGGGGGTTDDGDGGGAVLLMAFDSVILAGGGVHAGGGGGGGGLADIGAGGGGSGGMIVIDARDLVTSAQATIAANGGGGGGGGGAGAGNEGQAGQLSSNQAAGGTGGSAQGGDGGDGSGLSTAPSVGSDTSSAGAGGGGGGAGLIIFDIDRAIVGSPIVSPSPVAGGE